MEYINLVNTDIKVMGCMSFGDPASNMHAWTLNPEETEKIIKKSLDLGINFFDTANCYSAGTSKTDKAAANKYDSTKDMDMEIVKRVDELAKKKNVSMMQIALAWQLAKGVASPIIGVTKEKYIDDAVGTLNVKLSKEDVEYLEELYVAHKVVGAL